MTDPVRLASAVVERLTPTLGTATDAGPLARLHTAVRDRLRRDPYTDAVFTGAVERPGSPARLAALENTLAELLADDPQFAQVIVRLTDEAGAVVQAHDSGAVAGRDMTMRGRHVAGRDIHVTEHGDNIGNVILVAGDLQVPAQRESEVPRQTPTPPPGFVNRDDVLDWLGRLLADPQVSPRVVVLTGPPGVGRRAAIRRFAHRSRDRFAGGDLHIDGALYGTDVSGMLGAALRALGVRDAHMPETFAERVAHFRTRTARLPVLMVLENVAEPAQVRALVPAAAGSVVLVTSGADMGELRLDGAVFYEIGPLDADSSAELFARTAATPGATDLVRFCAGLPIAILVLAARVAALHGLPPDELQDEIADDRRRLSALSLGGKQIVSAAFTTSYESLPEDAQHLYRRLGLLPCADIGPDVAAVAAAVDIKAARRLLATLADAQLLETRPGGRFAFHDLIRLHAREIAAREPVEYQEAVLQQVVRHYLVRAAFADHAVMGTRTRIADHDVLLTGQDDPFGGRDPALAWLEAERANLVAVTRAASEQGLSTETWQLAEALTGYYLNHRYLTDWITTSELGARAARQDGNVRAEARLRTLLSRAYTSRGEIRQAGAELDKAIELAERSGDTVLRASAWEFRGRYLERTDHDAALAAYERSHDLNIEAGEWRGVALVLFYEGRLLADPELLGRALDLLRWHSDERMAARVLIALGAVHIDQGELDQATAVLADAVRELAGRHYEAEARELLAKIAQRTGDDEGGRAHLRRAQEIYRAAGHPRADEMARLLSSG